MIIDCAKCGKSHRDIEHLTPGTLKLLDGLMRPALRDLIDAINDQHAIPQAMKNATAILAAVDAEIEMVIAK